MTSSPQEIARLVEEARAAVLRIMKSNPMMSDEQLAIEIADALTRRVEGEGWRPTHRHRLRGTSYIVTGSATLQRQQSKPLPDETEMTVYRDKAGKFWVRATAEFNDGRFEALTPPASSSGEGKPRWPKCNQCGGRHAELKPGMCANKGVNGHDNGPLYCGDRP